MSQVDNTIGNIYIKHNDKWRGDYYLKDDFKFTTNRSLACRFYILKSGDTTILNGDRVSVHAGNRTWIIDDTNSVKLVNREQLIRESDSFIITNGIENTDPIIYNSPVFLITDRALKTALKYEWGMDIIESVNDIVTPNYKPHVQPTLVNSNYGNACEIHTNSFQFYLEHIDSPGLDSSKSDPNHESRSIMEIDSNVLTCPSSKSSTNIVEGYKGPILVMLLMVILVLCMLASK